MLFANDRCATVQRDDFVLVECACERRQSSSVGLTSQIIRPLAVGRLRVYFTVCVTLPPRGSCERASDSATLLQGVLVEKLDHAANMDHNPLELPSGIRERQVSVFDKFALARNDQAAARESAQFECCLIQASDIDPSHRHRFARIRGPVSLLPSGIADVHQDSESQPPAPTPSTSAPARSSSRTATRQPVTAPAPDQDPSRHGRGFAAMDIEAALGPAAAAELAAGTLQVNEAAFHTPPAGCAAARTDQPAPSSNAAVNIAAVTTASAEEDGGCAETDLPEQAETPVSSQDAESARARKRARSQHVVSSTSEHVSEHDMEMPSWWPPGSGMDEEGGIRGSRWKRRRGGVSGAPSRRLRRTRQRGAASPRHSAEQGMQEWLAATAPSQAPMQEPAAEPRRRDWKILLPAPIQAAPFSASNE